jgi:esterase/lipase superfamily enzyme
MGIWMEFEESAMNNKSDQNKGYLVLLLVFCVMVSVFSAGCASVSKGDKQYMKDLYKRLPYRISENYRILEVLYATTREKVQNSDRKLPYSARLSDTVSLGKMDVKIDPSLRIGKMLPEKLKASGTLEVERVNTMREEEFMREIRSQVEASPEKSLLVIVFGYMDDFGSNAIKAGWFAYMLDVDTPVLLFDWPGDQPVSIGGYKKARRYAESSGDDLGKLLIQIEEEINPEKLWVKGSSLGCEVICDAFEYMYRNRGRYENEVDISQVILAAPDVGEDDFREKFGRHIAVLSRKMTIYVSADDDALLLSDLVTGEKKLGRQRVTPPPQTQEAKDLLLLKSRDPGRITVIDVTPINDSSFHHGYYLECPEFFDDFYARVHGQGSEVNRRLYLLKYKGEIDYWVMQE